MTVFCDYLSVTCHPDHSFTDKVYSWLLQRFPVAHELTESGKLVKVVFDPCPSGVFRIEERSRFHIVTASGSAIQKLRDDDVWDDYLSLLSEVPHKVTRLDAAIDIPTDAPVVIESLFKQYPSEICLTRKALKCRRTLSTRTDGQVSGTWYAGQYSKARVTAKVYDKQLEAWEKRGEVLPPTTRYELTFRKEVGCTLKDAHMPASLFYQYASPKLIDKPDNIPDWESHGDGWEGDQVDTDITMAMYRRRVENSPEIGALSKLAARMGPGAVEMAVRIYRERLESTIDDQERESARESG